MFPKLLIAVALCVAVAAALLSLRQQRLQTMHEIARLHEQMDAARQRTWDLQVRIAQQLEPGALQAALKRASLELEPLVPMDEWSGQAEQRVVEMSHE